MPACIVLRPATEAYMKTPVQITFRRIDTSSAIEDYVQRRAAKLETFSDRILHCHVTIEAPHHHHKHGEPYRVRVEVKIPGADLVVGDRPKADAVHHDLYAAIDDTFDDAGRVLQDHVKRKWRDTNTHEERR
jgi:ribosomal subunit interface protein